MSFTMVNMEHYSRLQILDSNPLHSMITPILLHPKYSRNYNTDKQNFFFRPVTDTELGIGECECKGDGI